MFDDSSDEGEEVGFSINTGYADKYNKWRRAEELQKLKDRYGDVDTDSSTSESEDEEGEALTSQVEKGWLKTLAALKNKDPKIYQKDVRFYSSEESSDEKEEEKQKEKAAKPVYLKDYERKLMLEKHGKESSDESDSGVEAMVKSSDMNPGYYEQQDEIRKSLASAVDGSDDSDDDLLTQRKRTKEEEEQEEEEYMAWLKGQKKNLGKHRKMGKELEPLREYWNDPDLDPGEKFLKDFILNKRYMDRDTDRLPTYDEIVDDSEDLSDDEDEIENQEKFERKYNFRFEEPGAMEIKSFPRSIDDSVRRKDSKRTDKRHEKKERKKHEMVQRQEDLKMLKKFKRQEIEQKIATLREITGNKDIGFSSADLEGDFDSAEHERMMQKYFADDYYEGTEEEKPVCDLDNEDLNPENWDNWQGDDDAEENNGDEEPHADDPNFVMDVDYDPSQDNRSGKKKKKKSRLAKALSKKKPVFDPEDKTFEEYVDDYYKLDYEDMIGDIPCRFKYRKVVPNNFGLEVGEILTCRDKELNSWVSVKKMSQYRGEEEERHDMQVYARRAMTNKKLNILTSLKDSDKTNSSTTTAQDAPPQGTKSKKKRKAVSQTWTITEMAQTEEGTPSKKHKMDPGREEKADRKAEDSSPKKVKTETTAVEASTNVASTPSESTPAAKKKRKKKKKPKRKNDSGNVGENSSDVSGSVKTDMSGSTGNTNRPKNTAVSGKSDVSHSGEKKPNNSQKQKKNKKKGVKNFGMSDERLKAYGINPKKIRFMKTDNFKKEKSK